MEFILNAGLGIGTMLFLLLLFKRGKNQGDFFFLGWIGVMLGQISFYDITIYHYELSGFWAVSTFGLPLLGAPFLFLYILALTGHCVSWKTVLAHLGIYVIYILILFLLMEQNGVKPIIINGIFMLPENNPVWMQYYAVPLAISGLVYCVWDLLLLKRHRKNIGNLFSFDEKISLKWVNYIVYSYLILFLLASFFIFGSIHFEILTIKNAFAVVGIMLSLMLLNFGFYGLKQTTIFLNTGTQNTITSKLQVGTTEKASYLKSGLTTKKIKVFAEQLTKCMVSEKPFLNENLNLPLLAEQCKISQPYLSQIINQHFKMNFYDFVNQYRIEEAKTKLSSLDFNHMSLLGIAFECGFKSKSSFNRYFKKHTGSSPSEFKKNSPMGSSL